MKYGKVIVLSAALILFLSACGKEETGKGNEGIAKGEPTYDNKKKEEKGDVHAMEEKNLTNQTEKKKETTQEQGMTESEKQKQQLLEELKKDGSLESVAVDSVKGYLKEQNLLVEDQDHFVEYDHMNGDKYVVRYYQLVQDHTSTNGWYEVDFQKETVTDITTNPFGDNQ